jgi:hypothetical protein
MWFQSAIEIQQEKVSSKWLSNWDLCCFRFIRCNFTWRQWDARTGLRSDFSSVTSNVTDAANLDAFLSEQYKAAEINLFFPSFLISALYVISFILYTRNLRLSDSNRRPERDIFFFLLTPNSAIRTATCNFLPSCCSVKGFVLAVVCGTQDR